MSRFRGSDESRELPVTCEGCENCLPIGEGDFLCSEKSELCIKDYFPVLFPLGCSHFKEIED